MIVWRLFYMTLAIAIALLGFGIYTIYQARTEMMKADPGYSYGPLDADLKVVEFLNYSCEPCRRIHPVFMDAVKKDVNVLYIPMIVSSGGAPGAYAMNLTYAAGLQGKFHAVFEDFIENFRAVKESDVTDIALRHGMDPEKLNADATSEPVLKMIDKSITTHNKMGVRFTPTFFIGSDIQYVPQKTMPTSEDFLRMFAEARGIK